MAQTISQEPCSAIPAPANSPIRLTKRWWHDVRHASRLQYGGRHFGNSWEILRKAIRRPNTSTLLFGDPPLIVSVEDAWLEPVLQLYLETISHCSPMPTNRAQRAEVLETEMIARLLLAALRTISECVKASRKDHGIFHQQIVH